MLPWTVWHFKMGSRLTGQVKYMKTFLKEMHDLLKDVEVGSYYGEPFDQKSNTFNGHEGFQTNDGRTDPAQPLLGVETGREKYV